MVKHTASERWSHPELQAVSVEEKKRGGCGYWMGCGFRMGYI